MQPQPLHAFAFDPPAETTATSAAPAPSPFTFDARAFAMPMPMPSTSSDAGGAASLFNFATASPVNPFAGTFASTAAASAAPSAPAPAAFHAGSFSSSSHRAAGGRTRGLAAKATNDKQTTGAGTAVAHEHGAPATFPSVLAAVAPPLPVLAGAGAGVAAVPVVRPSYLGLNAQGIPQAVPDAEEDEEEAVAAPASVTESEEGRFEDGIGNTDSITTFNYKGRGATGMTAQMGSAEQPGAAERAIARAGRTKIKVTARRSAGPAAASDAASSSPASSSSASAPVVFTALSLSHTNGWIAERELWNQQDKGGVRGSSRTAQTIRETLIEQDVAAVLIDLILEFAEPPFVSEMHGSLLQPTESLLNKLRPGRPPLSIPIACSLDVLTLASTRLQLTLREVVESGEESLQRASRLTAEFLANEREARELISNEVHKHRTCGICKMEPIVGPCWIGLVGTAMETLCNTCKLARGPSSAASFTRVCGFVSAAQREALANPSCPDSAPAPPLTLSLPKSLVLELYISWQQPDRGQVAIPLLGWSDLAEFTLQSSEGQRVPPMPEDMFQDALKRLLPLDENGQLSSEQFANAQDLVARKGFSQIQRAALFWKHPTGRQAAANEGSPDPSSLLLDDDLMQYRRSASAGRQFGDDLSSVSQQLSRMQVGFDGAESLFDNDVVEL